MNIEEEYKNLKKELAFYKKSLKEQEKDYDELVYVLKEKVKTLEIINIKNDYTFKIKIPALLMDAKSLFNKSLIIIRGSKKHKTILNLLKDATEV